MSRLTSILLSFLLIAIACNSQPGDAAASDPAGTSDLVTSWTKFQDPAEQAFTVDVPRGWKITGGAYRFGPLDPRAMVDMVSPDGKINIRFGDYRIPPYSTLSTTMRQLGWREGHPYAPRNMSQGMVANYRSGWVFADLYGQARFSSQCTHLNLKSMKKANPVHPSNEANTTTTAGEVVYTCDSSDGPRVAYVFAETHLIEMQGIGSWLVTWLYSFIAPQNLADAVMKTTLHSLGTLAISQQWEYKQMQINGQANQYIMQDFQRNMASIQADYQRRSAAQQSQFESMDRVIRGVDLTTDSVDGRQREVWTGTGTPHWINGLNQVVDSPTQPGSNYHKLNTVP